MLGKPLCYAGHVLFEVTGRGEIESSGTSGAAILEIMCKAPWNEHKRAFGCINPFAADKEAHGALDYEENIVFRVGVSAWTLRVCF